MQLLLMFATLLASLHAMAPPPSCPAFMPNYPAEHRRRRTTESNAEGTQNPQKPLIDAMVKVIQTQNKKQAADAGAESTDVKVEDVSDTLLKNARVSQQISSLEKMVAAGLKDQELRANGAPYKTTGRLEEIIDMNWAKVRLQELEVGKIDGDNEASKALREALADKLGEDGDCHRCWISHIDGQAVDRQDSFNSKRLWYGPAQTEGVTVIFQKPEMYATGTVVQPRCGRAGGIDVSQAKQCTVEKSDDKANGEDAEQNQKPKEEKDADATPKKEDAKEPKVTINCTMQDEGNSIRLNLSLAEVDKQFTKKWDPQEAAKEKQKEEDAKKKKDAEEAKEKARWHQIEASTNKKWGIKVDISGIPWAVSEVTDGEVHKEIQEATPVVEGEKKPVEAGWEIIQVNDTPITQSNSHDLWQRIKHNPTGSDTDVTVTFKSRSTEDFKKDSTVSAKATHCDKVPDGMKGQKGKIVQVEKDKIQVEWTKISEDGDGAVMTKTFTYKQMDQFFDIEEPKAETTDAGAGENEESQEDKKKQKEEPQQEQKEKQQQKKPKETNEVAPDASKEKEPAADQPLTLQQQVTATASSATSTATSIAAAATAAAGGAPAPAGTKDSKARLL